MSWKGFTKAVSRLPHLVLQKAGAAEETKDADFTSLSLHFTKTCTSTERLMDDLQKYRDAIIKMLEHRLLQLEAWQTVLGNSKCDIQTLLTASRSIAKELQVNLDEYFTAKMIKLLNELLAAQKIISTKITKRNHKLLDYDRHRHSVRKQENSSATRSLTDQRKLSKTERDLLDAEVEYRKYNDLLKQDLPTYFDIHERLFCSILAYLITFQQRFYKLQYQAFSCAETAKLLGYREILQRFEIESANASSIINEIPLVQAMSGRIKSKPASSSSSTHKLDRADLSIVRKSSTSNSSIDENFKKSENIIDLVSSYPAEISTPLITTSPINSPHVPFTKIVTKDEKSLQYHQTDEKVDKFRAKPFYSPPAVTLSSIDMNANSSVTSKPPPSSINIIATPAITNNKAGGGRVAELAAKLGHVAIKGPYASYSAAPAQSAPPFSSYSNSNSSSPPLPPKKSNFVTALYDFSSQEVGDLSFRLGDKIELLKRTEKIDDWWTGSLEGRTGLFPGNYVSLDR